MRIRSRRFAVVILLTGVTMVAGPVTLAVAQTAEDASVGVFDATAEATGIGAAFGNPGAEPNPVAAGLVPNTMARLGSGPVGHALASMAWPGPLVGNAGTLAALVGVPLPPEALANANYPVRAEAQASGGDRAEQSLGPMYTVVDGEDSTARVAMSDFDSPAVVSAARIVTRSRSFLKDGQAAAEAVSHLEGLEIGGILRIDTIRSEARGTSDGTTATTEHDLTLTGVTVNGQGATIDQDGIKLGEQSTPNPLEPVVGGANEALAGAGMEAFLVRPSEEELEGGAGRVHSGSLVVIWKMGDGGERVTLVLGGASVRLQATPGSAFDLGDLGGDFGDFGDDQFGGGSDAGTDPGSFGGADLPAFDAGATAGPATDGGGGTGSEEAFVPVDFNTASAVSDRVPFGWMIIGVLGMGLVGMGLHALREQAIGAALVGSTCPLERGAT